MSAAAASKRVTSPYGRATNIAPSNPLTIMRACSRTGSIDAYRPLGPALGEHLGEPGLVPLQEVHDGALHGDGKSLILSGQHAAQAHALSAQDVSVQAHVSLKLGQGSTPGRVQLLESDHEAVRVPHEEGLAELCLRSEVVVKRRFRELELGGHVGIAEAVEASALDEALGHVEHLRRRADLAPARVLGHAFSSFRSAWRVVAVEPHGRPLTFTY